MIGWSDERAAHATHVAVPASQVVAKPAGLSFDVAGSLYVAGAAAVASVESVDPQAGETVVVSGVTGGVGVIAASCCSAAASRSSASPPSATGTGCARSA